MKEQDDISNWRKIVIRTDGLRWKVDSDETNSSMLEIMEVCRQLLNKFRKE